MQSAFGAGLFLSVEMHKSAQRSPKHLSKQSLSQLTLTAPFAQRSRLGFLHFGAAGTNYLSMENDSKAYPV